MIKEDTDHDEWRARLAHWLQREALIQFEEACVLSDQEENVSSSQSRFTQCVNNFDPAWSGQRLHQGSSRRLEYAVFNAALAIAHRRTDSRAGECMFELTAILNAGPAQATIESLDFIARYLEHAFDDAWRWAATLDGAVELYRLAEQVSLRFFDESK